MCYYSGYKPEAPKQEKPLTMLKDRSGAAVLVAMIVLNYMLGRNEPQASPEPWA